jgi:hypothetical protein
MTGHAERGTVMREHTVDTRDHSKKPRGHASQGHESSGHESSGPELQGQELQGQELRGRTPLGRATVDALRRSVGTRPRQWTAAITLLNAAASAAGLPSAIPVADRTLAALSDPVQSLASLVPLTGILLA